MRQRWLALLDDIDRARGDLQRALEDLGPLIQRARDDAAADRPFVEVPEAVDGEGSRAELLIAMETLRTALRNARAEFVRVLVEEQGLSVAEVARLMGRSRQLVDRLYRSARSGTDAGPEGD